MRVRENLGGMASVFASNVLDLVLQIYRVNYNIQSIRNVSHCFRGRGLNLLASRIPLYHIETMSKKLTLFSNIYELMTLEKAAVQKSRGPMDISHLSVVKNQCMVVHDGKIAWTGKKAKLPRQYLRAKEKKVNGNMFPAFIEAHTHSVFVGDRKHEFEMRNTGVSYQEIAKQGGGIYSTVNAARAASVQNISKTLQTHLQTFLRQGVTTVEVKSGYGLDSSSELKLLKAIQKTTTPIKVIPTFLGAHAIPKGITSSEYLRQLKKDLSEIKKKKLAKRVDVFIEEGYFSLDESRDYLEFAKSLGFDICIHADQLTRTGATVLAQEIGALSADHSICLSDDDIRKVAKSELTCVLLPSADLYIHSPFPPARKMIDGGVRVALSTDFNPGTSPSQSVQLVGLLARLKMNMSLPEVFAAWTLGAAYAVGLQQERGALLAGYDADFFVSDSSFVDFFYDLLSPSVLSVWIKGEQKV